MFVIETGTLIFRSEHDPLFWIRTQWPINFLADPPLREFGTYWEKDVIHFYNMNERVLRIQYTSILVKLVTRGLLLGTIDPIEHLQLVQGPSPPKDIVNGVVLAFPTIFLFSNFLEVLEESRVLTKDQHHLFPAYDPLYPSISCGRFWNVNKSGLEKILSAVSKIAAKVNFELAIKVTQGQSCDKFFVPTKITSRKGKDEDKGLHDEISFPILDESGNRSYAEKTIVEQLGLAPPHLELKCKNCKMLNKLLQKISDLSK